MTWPPLRIVARTRDVTLTGDVPPAAAPYLTAIRTVDRGLTARVGLEGPDGTVLRASYDGRRVALEVTREGRTKRHLSRRHARPRDPSELAVTLAGPVATAWTVEPRGPVARAQVLLDEAHPDLDVHDEAWCAGVAPANGRLAGFGRLGLRDLRLVTYADGSPHREEGGPLLLTATAAGPAGFRTAHTVVLALEGLATPEDPRDTPRLVHRADLFWRRPERPGVYGDHATHLVRDGDRWLAATSTWGDFHPTRHPRVTTTLATVPAVPGADGPGTDLTRGSHVLDTEPLDLPVEGLSSVGTWDPHLVRDDDGSWLVGYVSARRFFSFHPAVATGPDLHGLSLSAAATERGQCEGTTLLRDPDDGRWRVLATEREDGRTGYPVLDLGLRERDRLDAAFPSNLPWPTLAQVPGATGPEWVMVGFDGTTAGGRLPGYGTHGDLVVQRATR